MARTTTGLTANETLIRGGPGYCDCVQSVQLDVDLVSHRAIWVGGGGDISVNDHDGHTVVISGVAAGTLLPLSVERINAAGTTATKLVLWR
jgi:hypothetical protein